MKQSASRIPIVGLGASAGGLEALQRFFQSVPGDLGAAYVVIVHLAPDHESDLPEILARETRMKVVQVGDHSKIELQPDHVYVIAPDRKLEITDASVGAARFDQPRGQRAAVDLFFRSLCNAHTDVYAVILSGGGTDGSIGARAVKEAGGLVLVQDPHEATHESMPRAAIATGVADVVLPVRELAERLTDFLRNRNTPALADFEASEPAVEAAGEKALRDVLELLRRRTGHDFSKYKRNTVLRRLARRIQLNRSDGIPDYLRYLEHNVDELQALLNDLLITVTTFFRDPHAWMALREHVIAPLIESGDPDAPIRCWVPGCATGEEAYSLAMLLKEEMEQRQIQREVIIFASDVDERALAIAREGLYPGSVQADLSEQRLGRWFRATDDHYRVVQELRDCLVFATHSLQRDPPFSRLHLISCRNLLIYMDRELQDQVMSIFRYACRDDGYLFLGTSETANEELFRPVAKHHRVFRPREHTRARKLALPELTAGLPQIPRRSELGRARQHRESPGDQHRMLLEQGAPPSVVVDDRWDLVHLSETAGRFLQSRGGLPTHSVVDSVRPELRGELVAGLRRAFEANQQGMSEFVSVRFNGTPHRVALLIQPRGTEGDAARQALVMFLDAGPVTADQEAAAEPRPRSEREQMLLEKLHEAERHIEHLHTEHHSAEEDLRAVNEELQSLNEEYRSTTEELETSKEELQSINEELQTVNLELKMKLEEVSRAHDDLENLMVATDIATLFLDCNLCIKWFTPQLGSIFNVKSHDQGRPIRDITHSLKYADLVRDGRRVIEDLAPIVRDVTCEDGRAYILRLRPYRTAENRIDGVVMTLVDVTHLKRTEAILRDSEERFRALVDASAQMVWTTDTEGAVVEDSPSWRGFTGQTGEARRGWGWLDALHPDDRPAAEEAWRRSVRGVAPWNAEFRVYHAASGKFRWTSVRAVPLRATDGSVRGWVGMNIDTTERKQAEESLHEADHRKDEFLAMLGHELRNPLAAIRNSIQAAQAADVVDRALAVIDRQSRHMTRLVDDLLDVTRITRNKLELHRQPTDLRQCIEDAIAAVQPAIDSHQLRLELDLEDGPLYVDGDPERLAQALDNLLHNAVSFTNAGGTITVAMRREHGDAAITIRDTGDGIEPREIERLFEPYQQAHHDHRSSGLGLGLTLVRRLVELHGGTVTAQSEGTGHGSEFRVTLPLSGSAPAAKEPRADVRLPPRHRVLVVDDEADVADMFAALLERLGQDVAVVYTGEAALPVALEQRPEIAFLDLAMPGMNGEELARTLREHFPADALRLIALTGHRPRSDGAAFGDFQDHLLKPADAHTVVELLGRTDTRGAHG